MGRIVIPRPRRDAGSRYRSIYRVPIGDKRHKFDPHKDLGLLMKVLDTAVAVGGKISGAVGGIQEGPDTARARKLVADRKAAEGAAAPAATSDAAAAESAGLGDWSAGPESFLREWSGAIGAPVQGEGVEITSTPRGTGASVIPGGGAVAPSPEARADAVDYDKGYAEGEKVRLALDARKEAMGRFREAGRDILGEAALHEPKEFSTLPGSALVTIAGPEDPGSDRTISARADAGKLISTAQYEALADPRYRGKVSGRGLRQIAAYEAEKRRRSLLSGIEPGATHRDANPEAAWARAASLVRRAGPTGNEEALEEAQRIYIDVLDGVYGEVDDARRREIATTPEFTVVRQRAHAQALVDRAAETAERGFSANDEALLSEAEGLYIDALDQGQPAAMRRRVSGTDIFKRLREWANARDARAEGPHPGVGPEAPPVSPAPATGPGGIPPGPSPTPPEAAPDPAVVRVDTAAAGGDPRPAIKDAFDKAASLYAALQSERREESARVWNVAFLQRQDLGTLQALGGFADTPQKRAMLMDAISKNRDVQPTSVSDLLGMGEDHVRRAQKKALKAMKGAAPKRTGPKAVTDLAKSIYGMNLEAAKDRRAAAREARAAALHGSQLAELERKARVGAATESFDIREAEAMADLREEQARAAKAKADKLTRLRNRRGTRGDRDDKILAYNINFNRNKIDFDNKTGRWSDAALAEGLTEAWEREGYEGRKPQPHELEARRASRWRYETGPFADDTFNSAGLTAKGNGASRSVVRAISAGADDAARLERHVAAEAARARKAAEIPTQTSNRMAKLKGEIVQIREVLKKGEITDAEKAKLEARLKGTEAERATLVEQSGIIPLSDLSAMAGE